MSRVSRKFAVRQEEKRGLMIQHHTIGETGRRKAGRQSAEVAEQTREMIVLSALRVFAARGFDAVGTRDIALEAGITHGLLRHYFGSKEGVWRAVIDFAVQRFEMALFPDTRQQVDGLSTDAVEKLKDNILSFLLVCAQYPEMMQLMLHEGISGGTRFEYVMERFEQINARMAPLLERVQQRGYLLQFSNQSFFLYLFTAGGAPFGLHALSSRLIGADMLSAEQIREHQERLLTTLFP